MSHIFISYSRRDLDFAQKIVDALAENKLDTWIDWKSIPKGEDWEQEIYRGIEEADAFLFLISPDSVASEMCNKEIAHAVKNGKRILPVFIANVDDRGVYGVTDKFLHGEQKEEIIRRNFIICRQDKDNFDKAIQEIRTTIHTDYEWLKYHTELQVKALKWEQKKDNSRLLRGKELREAEEQLAGAGSLKDPQPTELHRNYVLASQRNEVHQRRQITIGLGFGLAIVAMLAVFAWNQRNSALNSEATAIAEANAKAIALVNEENARATAQSEKERAEQQARIALARMLVAQAQPLFATSKQMTSVLLAIQSMRILPAVETAQILQDNILAHPIAHMTYGLWVNSVAFSPDGRYVVSGSDDKTARVWEITTGKEITRMTHANGVNSVAFSLDGRYVVSGSNDKTVRIWETRTGKEIARMTHAEGVNSIAISPDGRYVVSGSIDNTIRTWEVTTGKEIARMTHAEDVTTVVFSSDGRYVASGSHDNTARVWEVTTGKEIARMTHGGWVSFIAFSPDGRYVASGSHDNTARVWEANTGKEIARMTHGGWVSSVAFSPDGRYVASTGCDQQIWVADIMTCTQGSARVWETSTGKEIARMTYDGDVYSAVFNPDGRYVVSAGCDQWNFESYSCTQSSARVWEVGIGKEITRMTDDSYMTFVVFSPDGRSVISAGCQGGDILGNCSQGILRVWEASTAKDVSRLVQEGEVTSVAFNPDGRLVVSGGCSQKDSLDYCTQGAAYIWNTNTGKETSRILHAGNVFSVAFSPTGEQVILGDSYGTACVLEVVTGREVTCMKHGEWVSSVSFSPDGKYVVSGGCDESGMACFSGSVRVWEAETGKEVARMWVDSYVSSVAFNPDSNYVVFGSDDNCVRVWEVGTEIEIKCMNHDGAVTSVAFSPDGKYVVSGSQDKTVRVWEISTGKEIARLWHDHWVSSVAFNPDGKYVVSGSADKTVRVWDVKTMEEITRMQYDSDISSVAFSPDGKFVASGGSDGIARVWIWRPGDLIDEACNRVTRNLTRAEWKQYIGDVLPYQAVCPNLPIGP